MSFSDRLAVVLAATQWQSVEGKSTEKWMSVAKECAKRLAQDECAFAQTLNAEIEKQASMQSEEEFTDYVYSALNGTDEDNAIDLLRVTIEACIADGEFTLDSACIINTVSDALGLYPADAIIEVAATMKGRGDVEVENEIEEIVVDKASQIPDEEK